ncbi:glutathione peroxidase [Rubinisphaera sp.]|uniref:glutathione peroxidase n=1 Tax=Rubinisphaera sp. TaxID=2024857 RepID=UPI000C116422|nr:glutathione peroxidase [Rubinisphaera sp.]MBV11403.1 glutathione peroxidase [Rubinisphaera sp.]HCS52540.1 glutathione peroxidase [Planctomycetaceae bacterium]|tara:strand:+ start:1087 stop:1644 length:558 start_codon:yes stop_codon:yes gene_type:complete
MKLFCALTILLIAGQSAFAAEPASSPLDFSAKSIEGKDVDLSKYDGKVVLIVNVASRCGATPQYETLQQLNETYSDKGLVILGFPCNQFGGQEPGSETQIQEFCSANYGVTFDMFSKIDVNGKEASPVYQFLTSKQTNPEFAGPIRWNFEKFLVNKEGNVVERFATGVQPDSPKVIAAIERELAK